MILIKIYIVFVALFLLAGACLGVERTPTPSTMVDHCVRAKEMVLRVCLMEPEEENCKTSSIAKRLTEIDRVCKLSERI